MIATWRYKLVTFLMGVALTSPALAARRALIVYETGSPLNAANTIDAALVARGFTVDQSTTLPASLDAYCCVWDVRPFGGLSATDRNRYLAHLNQGHGVALLGENAACCASPRNDAIQAFMRTTVDGGNVLISLNDIPNTSIEDANAASPINNIPNLVSQVTYDGVGAATFENVGDGEVLTSRVRFPNTVSAAWPAGTMANAPTGRVAIVLDINWLIETRFDTDNPEFLENLTHFLCPTADLGFTVDITSPAPMFVRECPDTVTVDGEVLSAGPDCVQPTTFTGPAPQLTADDGRGGWVPGGATGDMPSVFGPAPPPPPRIVLPSLDFALLAVTITNIDVSVNGGPFVPVTSTSPALPAAPPITYTAAALPLALGPNTITIRARDDMLMEAFATVSGSMDDTLPPTIDPASCQDQTIDLGAMCRIDYNQFPTATDQCDPMVDVTSSPVLPIIITTPSATVIAYTATDDAMLTDTCSRTVTAIDTTTPVLTCPLPQTLECLEKGGLSRPDAGVQAWLASATATDNCAGTTVTNDAPPFFASACPPGQATPVTFTATDPSMNTTSCVESLSVEDTTAPNLTATPVPLALECNAAGGVPASAASVQAWIATFTADDTCAAATTLSNDVPALIPSGCTPGQTTSVRFEAEDDCANVAAFTQGVTVVDTTKPTLVVPPPLTLECNATGGVLRTDPAIQTWLGSVTGSDVCDGVTFSNNAPLLFTSACVPGNVTVVNFTAVDNCANANVLPSPVTVRDTTAPALNVPGNITVECSGPGGVPITHPQIQRFLAAANASDICDGAPITHNAPALFPSGCGAGTTTTVTFTAVDNCGNATTKTANVTVRDTTPPAVTVPAPITLECNGPGGVPLTDPAIQAWLAAAAASDVCDGATLTHDAPALFASGCVPGAITTVTFTAVDNCGNSVSATSTVTVVDTTPPAVTTPAPITLECNSPFGVPVTDPAIQAWLAAAAANDICDGTTLTNDAPALFGSGCVPGAVTTVTFTAVDNCGNSASATSTVTVMDTTAPIATAVLRPAAPLPPRSPASPKTVCSPPTSRAFKIECGASDICDPAATTKARLLVTNHDVPSAGTCAKRVDAITVPCDSVVMIQLVAPPCPTKPPKSPRNPVEVISGLTVVTGEAVVLEVTATDNCGNAGVATYDPTTEPSPLCDEKLEDGTCCPAIASPPDEKCSMPPCGRCAATAAAEPARAVAGFGIACTKGEARQFALDDAAMSSCTGLSDPVCGGTCAAGGCATIGVELKKDTTVSCFKIGMPGLCPDDDGYRCEVTGNIGCDCACR